MYFVYEIMHAEKCIKHVRLDLESVPLIIIILICDMICMTYFVIGIKDL